MTRRSRPPDASNDGCVNGRAFATSTSCILPLPSNPFGGGFGQKEMLKTSASWDFIFEYSDIFCKSCTRIRPWRSPEANQRPSGDTSIQRTPTFGSALGGNSAS